jgi:hypothetical protein
VQIRLFVFLLGSALACLGASPITRAQGSATAVTLEITSGPVIGHRVASMIVMNSPCFYGDHFQFELTDEGELRVHAPLVCGKVNAGGGELICILGPELTCKARKEYSPDPDSAYAVDARGVSTGGKLYAWADPQQAATLFAGVRARATRTCDRVLFDQAADARRNSSSTPTPDVVADRASCKPVLVRACSATPAKLSNGKDVSILCPR